MSFAELFPPIDKEWLDHSRKRFASPFMGTKYDRISVDPMMLSHAAVACGYGIGDFYREPELGAHAVAYISQLYDLLPVTHWYFSLAWVSEMGPDIQYMDNMPPIIPQPLISSPTEVDRVEVPDVEQLRKGWTFQQFTKANDYIQKHLPEMFLPMVNVSDIAGSAAQLCGVDNFIMWTLSEPDAAHELCRKYTQTAINGAEAVASKWGSAMISTGSVLANNDVFSDQMVIDFSAKYLRKLVDGAFRKGAGPQVFYHMCGNHETDYKVFKQHLMWSPFTILHVGYMGRRVFPSDVLVKEYGQVATLMGSVDTRLMINPDPRAVYEQAKEQIIKGRDSPMGYILGTSCEVPPLAPPGNILALVRAAKDHGSYGKW
jgi:uroporphyrinogen decarboxylase